MAEIRRLDVGDGVTVEIRRQGDLYEFRPVHNDDPRSFASIEGNVELRMQGGAWAFVPDHLMHEARKAFEDDR